MSGAGNKAGFSARRAREVDEHGRRADAAQRARRLAEANADAMPVVAAVDAPRKVRVVDAPLVDPAPTGGLREVFANRYVLKLLVSRELAKMYAASFLGLLWSYIQPGMKFVVFYFIFGVVMNIDKMPHYEIHLFCGFVIVHYFQEMWGGGTRSIWGNKGLVLKMRVPREIFPVAAMIVAIYHVFPQLVLLLVLVLVIGWHFSFTAIAALLLSLAIVMVFGWAMGLIFSALNVLFRDTANLVNTIAMFTMFLTPSMYPFTMVRDLGVNHPVLYQIYMADPLVSATLLLQRAFWQPMGGFGEAGDHAFFPDELWMRGGLTLAGCLLFLYLGQRFFARLESKFPERL